MLIYELPLHEAVIGVWCALCEAGFVEPVVYSHRYVTFRHRFCGSIFTISREPLSLLSKSLNSSHSQQFRALLR
jgi:hypothetical protein